MEYLKSHLRRLSVLFMVLLLGAGIGSAWVAAQQPADPIPTETMSGWFGTLWVDDFDHPENSTVRFFLANDAGQSIDLDVSDELLRQHGGIQGLNSRRVKIIVESPVIPPPGPESVQPSAKKRKVLSIESVAGPEAVQTGSKPFVTLLCKYADTGRDPEKKSYFQGLMGSTYPGVDHFWRENSYDAMNLNGSVVLGWYTLPRTYAEYLSTGDPYGNELIDCAAAADRDVYFPDFYGINLMLPSGHTVSLGGLSGLVTLDGVTKVWPTTWNVQWDWQVVVAHEMGHTLGLPHSSGYDSGWDVMSSGGFNNLMEDPIYGRVGVHTISRHKDFLGWIPSGQKYTAGPNTRQTITLERLALPTDGGTAYRMAQIPINTPNYYFYTVEARRFAGYDIRLPLEGVVIHKVNPTGSFLQVQATVVDGDGNGNLNDAGAAWTVGETFQDALNDVTVTVDADAGTGYVVTISTERLGPAVVTGAATNITDFQATLNGTANPKGEATEAWFEWGLTTAYGNTTAVQNMGSGTADVAFTDVIAGLAPGTTYHFRAVGRNGSGTTYGADQSFKTQGASIDLAPNINISGPPEMELGTTSGVIVTVFNYGTDPAGPFSIGVYLADNPLLTGWKRQIGTYSVSNGLAPGLGVGPSIPVTIPNDVAPGTYYLVGFADSGLVVTETDESNNIRSAGTILISRLDLMMTSVGGPSTGEAGIGITLSDTTQIQGAGWGRSPSFAVGFYLSSDATITTSDTFMGSRSVPSGLLPPASSSGTTNVTIPGSTPAGTYYVGAIADYQNGIVENNENNNGLAGNTIQVAASRPDLVVNSVSGPGTAAPGSGISISTTVRNQGAGSTAESFLVGLYLSTDAVITGNDMLLGSLVMPVLAAGQSSTSSASVTLPNAPGTYYLGAIVDYPNSVNESNETNNALTGSSIQIGNFPPTVVTQAATGISGIQATLNGTANPKGQATDAWFQWGSTKNYGNTSAAQAMGNGDIDRSYSQIITGLTPGTTYHFRAVARNASDTVYGSDTTFLAPAIDLVPTGINGPTSAYPGSPIAVSATITNRGANDVGLFRVDLYLADNPQLTGWKQELDRRPVESLPAAQSAIVNFTGTIPAGIALGPYYLVVFADPDQRMVETNESNNLLANPIAIILFSNEPDLTISAVSGPTSARRGDTITGNVTVRNEGGAATGAGFTVGIYLSTDAVITSSDIALGTLSASALNAGVSATLSYSKVIPSGIARTTYYIGAIADSTNVIAESNENNNAKAGNTISIR